MKTDFQIEHLVERYVSGDLSGAELKDFESSLEGDASLRDLVQTEKSSQNLMHAGRLDALLVQMDGDWNEAYNQKPKTSGIWKLGTLIFAVMTTAGSIVFWPTDKDVEPVLPHESIPQDIIIPKANPNGNQTKSTEDQEVIGNGNSASLDNSQQQPTKVPDHNEGATLESGLSKSTDTVIPKPQDIELQLAPVNTKKDCEAVKITGSVTSFPACLSSHDGSIMIINSDLPKRKKRFTLFADNNPCDGLTCKNLAPGAHFLYIEDHKGCVSTPIKVSVNGKLCGDETSYTLDTKSMKSLEIPVKDNVTTRLEISTLSGHSIWSTESNNEDVIIWNGSTGSGKITEGTYMYILSPEGGKVTTGTIVVK